MFSRSSRGRSENVLRTSQNDLLRTSLGRQIRMSPGSHFETSPWRQFGTSLGWSNRIFRERPGDVSGTSCKPKFAGWEISWDQGVVSLSWLVFYNFFNSFLFFFEQIFCNKKCLRTQPEIPCSCNDLFHSFFKRMCISKISFSNFLAPSSFKIEGIS